MSIESVGLIGAVASSDTIGASGALIYDVSGGIAYIVASSLFVCNTLSTATHFSVWVDSGSSRYYLYYHNPIGPYETFVTTTGISVSDPSLGVGAGSQVYASAGVSTGVGFTMFGIVAQ